MRTVRRHIAVLLALLATALGSACRSTDDTESMQVTLRAGETYEFAMATGDEDGARIVMQAAHFAVSEIRRDASTNYAAVYVYAPAAGYVGEDRAQLEITTGSDGASAPTRRRLVTIRFSVRE